MARRDGRLSRGETRLIKEGGKNRTMKMTSKQAAALMETLAARFAKHRSRHPKVEWATVEARLLAEPGKVRVLHEMERTGGEPDVVGVEPGTGAILFFDCAEESPEGRRSLCYDGDALAARKENRPAGSAMEMAASLGFELLSEEEYRHLQTLGRFDAKTSSWVKTPPAIRKLGGALFCDRRYETVFVYHNGAQSYYAARGFRGKLRV